MKKVLYIVDKHHHALKAWGKIKQEVGSFNLVTLDHHTDTRPAFEYFLYYNRNKTRGELLSLIDCSSLSLIERAMTHLRNDEQIDAAVQAGIIGKAFVISYDGRFNHPPIK